MDFSEIAKLRKYFTVKHSIPGRLRVKFSKDLLNNQEVVEFFEKSDLPPTIATVTINMFSKSLLIKYDPQVLSQNSLEQLLTVATDSEAESIALQINDILYP